MEEMVVGIYVIRNEGAEVTDPPEDIGIIIEGVEVLGGLGDVASGCALPLGLIYSLNLNYPKDLRYTFEFIHKVLMQLNSNKLLIYQHLLILCCATMPFFCKLYLHFELCCRCKMSKDMLCFCFTQFVIRQRKLPACAVDNVLVFAAACYITVHILNILAFWTGTAVPHKFLTF